MATELDELVEFLHHGNAQIRQIATEHLLGYSLSQPAIFKTQALTPIKDLKMLIKDSPPISKNALTLLINLSGDAAVVGALAGDDAFLETLLSRISSPGEPNANELAILLANLAKSDDIARIVQVRRSVPAPLSKSPRAMDQLMDCFVKGADGAYNKAADYDYLAYFFADMAKFPEARSYFTTPQPADDNIVPISKLLVFTENKSSIRRQGVASAIKNTCFDTGSHASLLSETGANILPYILLPLAGPEDYSEEDMDGMPEDLQLLPPDKQRERDSQTMQAHLESLLLLASTRRGRDALRQRKVYPLIRETHLHVEDEAVRDLCDRIVQVLMRDEEEDTAPADSVGLDTDDDDDHRIVQVF